MKEGLYHRLLFQVSSFKICSKMMMTCIYSVSCLVDLSSLEYRHEYPWNTTMIWIYSTTSLVDLSTLTNRSHEYPSNWKIIFEMTHYFLL